MIEVRPLTDENLSDAEAVVAARFPASALEVLHKEMRNPLRAVCNEVGDVAYVDGRAVAFQAVVLRRIYFRQRSFIGHVSGLAAVLKDAPFRSLMMIRKAAHIAQARRGDAKIRFGNTHCASTAQLAAVMKRVSGPESCAEYNWQIVSYIRSWIYFIRRKILHLPVPPAKSVPRDLAYEHVRADLRISRLSSFEPTFFDVLMEKYVETNKGLVLSRRADDLKWIFDEPVKRGGAVILGAWEDGSPVGHIIVSRLADGSKWMVRDWFALEDRGRVLEGLLKEARRFLRIHTPATILMIKGFPMWIQDVVRRNFSHRVKCGVNCFSYNMIDQDFANMCTAKVLESASWFFGPYDGDACFES